MNGLLCQRVPARVFCRLMRFPAVCLLRLYLLESHRKEGWRAVFPQYGFPPVENGTDITTASEPGRSS